MIVWLKVKIMLICFVGYNILIEEVRCVFIGRFLLMVMICNVVLGVVSVILVIELLE